MVGVGLEYACDSVLRTNGRQSDVGVDGVSIDRRKFAQGGERKSIVLQLSFATTSGGWLRSMNATAQPKSLLDWLRCFGPGAILASLTIGVGELVFSTRAGALFGYRLLWFFALVLFFKWLLVYSTTRHMALTGAHPFQRW